MTETLEPRLLLDGNGMILGDARLTLSFAPDGTEAAGETSALFAQMDAIAPRLEWQAAILRGFQTWARETNGDIGVVTDDMSEFGTNGKMRRDSRFGDIRIGAIPLDDDLFATSISSAQVIDGTWTGDVFFNSNVNLETLDEVFAITLHEAGHVFGLDHNDDPNSPMFEHGLPASVIPTVGDLAALQNVFGPRSPDVYDLEALEDGTAGPIELEVFRTESDIRGSAPTVAFADISSFDDVDQYLIEAPSQYSGSVTVELVASGISLLTSELMVLTESGNPLGGASTFVPGTDTSVTINNVGDGDKLLIDIQANGTDEYSVGGYSLVIWFNATNEVLAPSIQEFLREPIRHIESEELEEYFEEGQVFFANDDDGTDDDEGLENRLKTTSGFAPGIQYQIQASIEAAMDADRYVMKTPNNLSPGNEWGRLTLRAIDPDFVGDIRVFDDKFQELTTTVLVHNDEATILQLGPIAADTDYFVEIAAAESSTSATGNYEFLAQFSVSEAQRQSFRTGTLSPQSSFQRHQLRVFRPQLFQFHLQVSEATGTNVAVELDIVDMRGNVLSTTTADAGDTRTMAVFLPTGRYRVVVRAPSGLDPLVPVDYTLSGATIDNPLGPRLNDPTGDPFTFAERARVLVALAVFGLN